MNDDFPLIAVVKQTHLSRPPAPNSSAVAAASVALLVLTSVSHRTHAIGFGLGVVLAVAYFWARKDTLRRAEQVVWE